MAPRVSVVMAVYNCPRRHLNESVVSILSQTMEDFEFIIIDDHSSTYKVRDVLSCLSDKRLRIYRNSANLGLTKSLNIGVKAAKSNLIARMDADDISEKDRLMTQLRFLKNHTMCSLVGSDARIIDYNSKVVRFKRRIGSYEGVCFYSYINNPFMHSSAVFYKDCFYEVGGYDEYFRYSQDYDLWCRFLRRYRGVNISRSLVRWRESNQGISSTKCKEQIKYADKIVLTHFRETLPELKAIPQSALLAVRHNRYSRSTLFLTDIIVKAMYKNNMCSYSKSWYESYLIRTKCFR